MRKRFGTIPKGLLAEQETFRDGDLRMVLRAGFWPTASRDTDIIPEAAAAAMALFVLGGVPLSHLDGIEAADAFPEATPDKVSVPIAHDRIETVEMPPTVVRIVNIWKRVRPTGGSSKLFVTLDGEPMGHETLRRHIDDGVSALGMRGTPRTIAKLFAIDRFRRHPDFAEAEAAKLKRYLVRLNGHHLHQPRPTQEDLKLFFERCDPFSSLGARDFSDAASIAHARELGTDLPDTYLECFKPAVDHTTRGLPADHPLLREISAATVKGRIPKAKRIEIYLKYRGELNERAADGSLLRREAGALFGIGYTKYWLLARDAEALIGVEKPRGRHYPRKPRALAAPTEDEAVRLKRVADIKWPPKQTRDGFRRSVLHKHGAFVCGLVEDDKLTQREAGRLFRFNAKSFTDYKLDVAAGVAAHWYAPFPSREESAKWQAAVFATRSERKEGQAATDFVRELRKRIPLPISQSLAIEALKERPGACANPTKGAIRIAMSAEASRRLGIVRASRWPANRKLHERHRLGLLRSHGVFVFDLVVQRRLTAADAMKLFKVDRVRTSDLVALHRAGDLHLALSMRSHAEKKRAHELFVREFGRRGVETGPAELCRDIRRRTGIYIPASQARNIFYRQLKNSTKGIGAAVPARRRWGRIAVPPSAEERKRLRRVATVDWNVEDVASLRRDVFRSDGEFLMNMLDQRKISVAETAKLVRIPKTLFGSVINDWKAGLFARHLDPPPQGTERQLQLAIVRREARPAERFEVFVRRLGSMGVLLPRHVIKKLRKRVLAERRAAA